MKKNSKEQGFTKKVIFTSCALFLSCLVTLILIEATLYFFPVNEGLRATPVNNDNPIFKFQANRKAQYSKHWNFDIRNKVSINNDGFVNDIDYKEGQATPLLSLIGDSYIEALMVPYAETISGVLHRKSKNKRVYSFAASGAGLSQHLIWAEYAREKFNSEFFIFFIIANDFSEALAKHEKSPGFHRFKRINDNDWSMVLAEYNPSLTRKILRNSKLAMYLITNVKVHNIMNIDLKLGKNDKRESFVSNFSANYNEEFWNDATWATRTYLDNVEKYTSAKSRNILFVIDGIRPQLYNGKFEKSVIESFWYQMRKYFMQEAAKRNYEVLDMNKLFSEDYNVNKKKFEYKTDAHWNSYGHFIVAKSITKTKVWNKFLYSNQIETK